MTIKVLGPSDEAILESIAPDVFDDALDPRAMKEFLSDPRHHLVVALDQGQVVGFVSAVEYVHPDKPRPELWINEVGVAATHRRRGVAKAMLQSMLALAREKGCLDAWVLTESSNDAAMRLYSSAGGTKSADDTVMFTFSVADGG